MLLGAFIVLGILLPLFFRMDRFLKDFADSATVLARFINQITKERSETLAEIDRLQSLMENILLQQESDSEYDNH